MWTTLIAVIGTLAGTGLAGLLQHRTARTARTDSRRDAAVQAVAALAAALADHRRAMWVREDLRLTGASPEAYEAARADSHATRSAITAPLTTVSVLAPALAPAATAAAQAAYDLRAAADRAALTTDRDRALAAADGLVAAAARQFGA
ncbi:plasmid transfer protein KilB [Streptomyces coelicoflavus]|uniref:plasmid transfer protein KilB n=1 Tax=Bacteria TaxID=2 RepID=UPI00380FA4CD